MRSLVLTAMIAVAFGGCGMGPEYTAQPGCQPQAVAPMQPVAAPAYANPIFIPVADHQCAWEQVVDVVDDYFRTNDKDSEPVRQVGNMVTEGHLVTFPEVSPTIFEPWRHDTVDPEQRLENTLQTMRRRAVVRVIPAQGGHLVDVQVFKDLEDNRRPDFTSAGTATFRYDDTLTGIINPITGQEITRGWICKGRDVSLEQYMIGDLLSRCGPQGAPMVVRGQDGGK
jgi:hypothetical protein